MGRFVRGHLAIRRWNWREERKAEGQAKGEGGSDMLRKGKVVDGGRKEGGREEEEVELESVSRGSWGSEI